MEVGPFEVAPWRGTSSTRSEASGPGQDASSWRSCPGVLGAMMSNPVKVRHGLFNLLSNAAAFTEGGEVRLAAKRR